ncbi:MAG: 2'-5' RNA ligase family protein [Acidimicrobiales bacterium]
MEGRVHLVLYVPLPPLDEVVDPYRHPGALPAHVTLWAPWSDDCDLSRTDTAVLRAAQCCPRWHTDFFAVSWFGRRVVMIQPRTADPFVELRALLGEPPHPGGPKERPFVPHVTVATRWPYVHLREAARWADTHLPVRVPVTDVALARRDHVAHAWVEICRWALREPSSAVPDPQRDPSPTPG